MQRIFPRLIPPLPYDCSWKLGLVISSIPKLVQAKDEDGTQFYQSAVTSKENKQPLHLPKESYPNAVEGQGYSSWYSDWVTGSTDRSSNPGPRFSHLRTHPDRLRGPASLHFKG